MKVCWSEGKKASYILGDGAFKFLSVLPEISLNDYGVFLGDGGKDDAMKQMVQQMSQTALKVETCLCLMLLKFLRLIVLMKLTVLERGMDTRKTTATTTRTNATTATSCYATTSSRKANGRKKKR